MTGHREFTKGGWWLESPPWPLDSAMECKADRVFAAAHAKPATSPMRCPRCRFSDYINVTGHPATANSLKAGWWSESPRWPWWLPTFMRRTRDGGIYGNVGNRDLFGRHRQRCARWVPRSDRGRSLHRAGHRQAP